MYFAFFQKISNMNPAQLILASVLGIVLLLWLVMKLKLNAFIALLLVSLLVGLGAGMPFESVIKSVIDGMGNTLGFIALVVGLGSMFGKMLEISGGAERLAKSILEKFGEKNASWAMTITGFLVAIPVFFDVGFIIIVPLVYGLTKKSGKSLLLFAIPLLAGLATTHAFIPPTPGPIAVANLMNADLGWVIIFGFIAGIPTVILSGPLFGRIISKKIRKGIPGYMHMDSLKKGKKLPSFQTVIVLILIPLVLIITNTLCEFLLDPENKVLVVTNIAGHPVVALLITVLLSIILLARKQGYTKKEIESYLTKSLEPAGIIILITGAGGVFKQVLIDSGVGNMLADFMNDSSLPPLILAFLIASAVRIIQGSSTVAMVTASGILAPVISTMGIEGPLLALYVIVIASGSTILSHVNDSGFWLVNKYCGLTEKETFQSWTIMETIIAFSGLLMALIISLFL